MAKYRDRDNYTIFGNNKTFWNRQLMEPVGDIGDKKTSRSHSDTKRTTDFIELMRTEWASVVRPIGTQQKQGEEEEHRVVICHLDNKMPTIFNDRFDPPKLLLLPRWQKEILIIFPFLSSRLNLLFYCYFLRLVDRLEILVIKKIRTRK